MIVLLEDDDAIRNFVLYALNNSGLKAVGFDHPQKFWDYVKTTVPRLVILDIMLPDEDGLTILKKLRAAGKTRNLPIMLLTAKGTEFDKVIGLDSGADDYVIKPFGAMELLSRIRALLRRSENTASAREEYTVGKLYVCPDKHIVRVDGRDVSLTYKEFELLCLLLRDGGTVFTRDQILNRIWGYDFDGENRTVDVHIRTLRTKLGECGSVIETVRGVGYKLGAVEKEKKA